MAAEGDKIDLLAFAAHPDDAELGCGGTLIMEARRGRKTGVVDLTRGELGTRGTPETRDAEARAASEILGLSVRANLGLADGFFRPDRESIDSVVRHIRLFRPDVILAPAICDRHPDHGRASRLIAEASFLSGLRKIETSWEGKPQKPWRAGVLYHYIQDRWIKPDFAVDISEVMEQKMKAVMAFQTQFHDPESTEPATYISSPEFMDNIRARAAETGRPIGYKYAEGFVAERRLGLDSIFDLK